MTWAARWADAAPAQRMRSKWLLFQALITAALSIQVLSGLDGAVPQGMVWTALLWMAALCGLIGLLPEGLIAADWFPGLMGGLDIALVAMLAAVSGQAGPDQYLAYFAILLIVTTMQIPVRLAPFVVLVTVIYGWASYRGVDATAAEVLRHLLRLSVLLILALLYQRMARAACVAAQTDPVTGLPNRRHLLRLLSEGLSQGRTAAEQALLYIDIAGFKRINEAMGDGAGDQVLAAAVGRIRSCLRSADILARAGADEFVVYMSGRGAGEAAPHAARRICAAMKAPFNVGGTEVFAGVHIGMVLCGPEGASPDRVLTQAAAAARCAKEREQTECLDYEPGMTVSAALQLTREGRLHRAVERGEIVVHYQPVIDLASRRIAGVEALARWQDPEVGLVQPEMFIALAEDTGLIAPIGEFVLRQACVQWAAWRRAGYPALQLAVNVSVRQFRQPDLAACIAGVLAETGIDPASLNLELTESCFVKDPDAGLRILRQLKALGLRLSIDDFGTGYSSLLSLKRFPVDTLKIDRTFTHDMVASPRAAAVVASMLALAEAMELEVIAEGVETEAAAALLRMQGCRLVQGYVFSRPVPAEELTAWLAQGAGLERPVHSHGAAV